MVEGTIPLFKRKEREDTMKRATLIVLDSLGVGQMPDAKKF